MLNFKVFYSYIIHDRLNNYTQIHFTKLILRFIYIELNTCTTFSIHKSQLKHAL